MLCRSPRRISSKRNRRWYRPNGPEQAYASDASPLSQREPGQIFGSFDRNCRKHVESRCRSATRPTDTRNRGLEGNPSDFIHDLVSGGGAQLRKPSWAPSRTPSSGTRTKTKPRRWRASKRRTLQAGRRWKRGRHAKPRQSAHRWLRSSRRRREPRSQRQWRKGEPHFRRSNFCQCDLCRIPGTRNKWRFRNERVRSSKPWQVPDIQPHFP